MTVTDSEVISAFEKELERLRLRVKKLTEASRKCIDAAIEAHMAMHENKVVSMDLADLKALRKLGFELDNLSKALEDK